MRQLCRLAGGQNNPAVPSRRVPPGYVPSGDLRAAHLEAKSKRPRWHLVNLLLCLALLSLCLATSLMEVQTAWAETQAHLTHASPHPTGTDSSDSSSGNDKISDPCNSNCNDPASIVVALVYLVVDGVKVVIALFQNDLLGWVTCVLSAGAVSCPTTSGGAPWSFDCPIVHLSATFSSYSYDSSTGLVTTSLGSTTYTLTLDGATADNAQETIYQLAQNAVGNDAVNDWLSGDAFVGNTKASATSNLASEPGHLIYTYNADTVSQPHVQSLSSFSMLVGLTMIGGLFALAGFQLLIASMGIASHYAVANAIDTLGRVLLVAAIVGLSLLVVQTLLDLTNQLNDAVVKLHQQIRYPQTSIDGITAVSFSNAHDTSQSFRGVVMPMALWGCVLDDFIGLMTTRMANIIGSSIPGIGGVLGIAGRINEIGQLINDIGEFVLLVLSVTLWGQAIARVFLLDYYIILAPVAFACWGLPGRVGVQTTRAWFKGFLQLLFMQTVQIFILTTVPAFLPDFGLMQFPHGGDLINPPLQRLFAQLPPIIVAMAATGAPKVMMGMGPMNTVAKAGALAGKAVGAGMLAINHMIKK